MFFYFQKVRNTYGANLSDGVDNIFGRLLDEELLGVLVVHLRVQDQIGNLNQRQILKVPPSRQTYNLQLYLSGYLQWDKERASNIRSG